MITKLSQTKEDNQGQTNTTEDKQIQPKTTIDIKDNQSRQEYQGQPKTQDNQKQQDNHIQPRTNNDNLGQPRT